MSSGNGITKVRISETDKNGNSLTGWLNSIAASGHTSNLGILSFYQEDDPKIYTHFKVQSITDEGSYRELTGVQLAGHGEGGSGNPNDGDSILVGFAPTGAKGAKGEVGPQGK